MEIIEEQTNILIEKLLSVVDKWLEKYIAEKDENGEYWGWDTNVGDLKDAKLELLANITDLLKP